MTALGNSSAAQRESQGCPELPQITVINSRASLTNESKTLNKKDNLKKHHYSHKDSLSRLQKQTAHKQQPLKTN